MVARAVLVVAGFSLIGCGNGGDAADRGVGVKEAHTAGTGTGAARPGTVSPEKKEITPDIPPGTSLAQLTGGQSTAVERSSELTVRAALGALTLQIASIAARDRFR
jgi:hypothetical protein